MCLLKLTRIRANQYLLLEAFQIVSGVYYIYVCIFLKVMYTYLHVSFFKFYFLPEISTIYIFMYTYSYILLIICFKFCFHHYFFFVVTTQIQIQTQTHTHTYSYMYVVSIDSLSDKTHACNNARDLCKDLALNECTMMKELRTRC